MFPDEGDSSNNNRRISQPWIWDETRYNLEQVYKALLRRQEEIKSHIHAPTQPSLPRPTFEYNYDSITQLPLPPCSSKVNFGSCQIPALVNPAFEINYGSSTQPSLSRCSSKVNFGSDQIHLPAQPDNLAASKNNRILRNKRKNGWTEAEHRLFLHGLKRFGKGDWKNIAEHCVMSKTSTQVASHAQKYFLRQNGNQPKKRKSIHDTTFEENGVDNQNVDLIPPRLNQEMIPLQVNQQMTPPNQEVVNVISSPLDQEMVNVISPPLDQEMVNKVSPLKEADDFDLDKFISDLISTDYEIDSFNYVIEP